jgi:hypothetical protein
MIAFMPIDTRPLFGHEPIRHESGNESSVRHSPCANCTEFHKAAGALQASLAFKDFEPYVGVADG